MESKRTVIFSKINDDHTAYVINVGINEISLFKNLYDNGLELVNKDCISDGEMLMLLRHCCTDGFVECVLSIENHYNRDQSQINIYKSNIIQRLEAQGCTIITHCEWKPSFKNMDDFAATINSRNYLTLILENTDKSKKKLDNLEKEIKKLDEEIVEKRKKINQQNWYIEQTKTTEIKYEQLKKDFDKLIERYKKGEEICKKQEEEAREKWPDELKELKEEIDKLKNDYNSLVDKYTKKMDELCILKDDIFDCKKEKDKLNKINANLKEVISQKIENVVEQQKVKYHIDNLSMEDKIEKFKTTCEMYKLNDWDMPEFEIKFAKSYGLTDDVIQQILNISK